MCARAKLTRISFEKVHRFRGKELGDYISVDLAVFVNCESREEYKYVVCLLDHATKMSWVYPMKTRDEYFEKLCYFVDVELHRLNVKIKHYHADRGCGVKQQTSAESAEARRSAVHLESCGHARAECDFGEEVPDSR